MDETLEEIFEGCERDDFEDIFETAKLISGSDPGVVKAMEAALDAPVKYITKNAERFSERGIELDDEDSFEDLDADEFIFLGMVDELEEHGFAFEFDYKCGLEDFLRGLEQLKNYGLIADAVKTVKLDENDDIEEWGSAINKALGSTAQLCYIEIDSDSYPVAIVPAEALKETLIPMVIAM